MTQAPARPAVRREVFPVYAAGFVTALIGAGVATATPAGFATATPAGFATATPAGFARLAATAPPGQLGQTMGAAEAGRELGDAGGPVLVGAFGLVSLTAGLGALAATLLLCAALAVPRNRASPSHPPAGIT